MLDEFERRAAAIRYAAPRIPLISNLTGKVFAADERPDAHYWRRHARSTVRFAACIDSLRAFGASALIEVGPHPTLLALAARALPEAKWTTAASLRQGRDDRREIRASLGALFTCGASVKADALAGEHGRRVALPTYPFQRERHWVEPPLTTPQARPASPRSLRPLELRDLYYHVQWRPQPLEGSPRAAGTGPWVVFADRAGLANRIARLRQLHNRRTVLVRPGDQWSIEGDEITIRGDQVGDYQRVFETVGGVEAVLHAWSLDTFPEPETALQNGAGSVLRLLQGLLAVNGRVRPRVWLVSEGTQPAGDGQRCESPWGGSLWGLGRALAAEHSELWGGLLDVQPEAADTDQLIVREVDTGSADDAVAFRDGQRFVPRLERGHNGARATRFNLRADGTYIVTGGLGGIGLAMARWLVERGARQLLLIGRTPLPSADDVTGRPADDPAARRVAAIEAMRSLGAQVETAALDVSDAGALRACLDARRERGSAPVSGVIHAAGVVQFQPLATQDAESLGPVLAAKVRGAWNLHRALVDEPLDFFVMCSSTSALLSSPLLGAYAAANSFLDSLAWYRRTAGLAALSVNWGTWGEVGMAVDGGRRGEMLTGINTIPTSQGLSALGELLEHGVVQATVMPVDWAQLQQSYPTFAAAPFFAGLISNLGSGPDPRRASSLSLAQLHEASADARPGLVSAYLRVEAARVLGFVPERLDATAPLSSFGFDSLMAVQLKNRIEGDLRVVVPMMAFLQGPSVDELLPLVLSAIESGDSASLAGHAPEPWEEGTL
jgi:acyl transferase domain-containing protein